MAKPCRSLVPKAEINGRETEKRKRKCGKEEIIQKTGNIEERKYRNEEIQKRRNRQPANPKSEKQKQTTESGGREAESGKKEKTSNSPSTASRGRTDRQTSPHSYLKAHRPPPNMSALPVLSSLPGPLRTHLHAQLHPTAPSPPACLPACLPAWP